MHTNLSPWLLEVNSSRESCFLHQDKHADIVVVGGGIAGIATAYFLLKYTTKKIIILEAGKVAHGATGHNAGQVVDYFEKSFSEIVHQYGQEMAQNAQQEVTYGWNILAQILSEIPQRIDFECFDGYAGCATLEVFIGHLENKYWKQKLGFPVRNVMIAEDYKDFKLIPKEYQQFCHRVPGEYIQEKLSTKKEEYFALFSSQKGCINSALFTENLLQMLIVKYKDRFQIYEYSPIETIELKFQEVCVSTRLATVYAENVVLCTNGFQNFHIFDNEKRYLEQSFHNSLYCLVGYMAGYIETNEYTTTAISYLPKKHRYFFDDSYMYLTRRNFTYSEMKQKLTVIGGPDHLFRKNFEYSSHHVFPKYARKQLMNFLDKHYVYAPSERRNFDFEWHGPMGYTNTGLRKVGFDPQHKRLLYNLGCNGVGILPSLAGAKKIAALLNGEKVFPSIFDPVVDS